MAKFKITFNNTAGVLDQREIEVPGDGEEGIPFSTFVSKLGTLPVRDGDSFTVELVQDARGDTQMLSNVWHHAIAAQAVVNGRLVTVIHDVAGVASAGTLVCEAAAPGTGDDLTVTRLGRRFMDAGVFTPRG